MVGNLEQEPFVLSKKWPEACFLPGHPSSLNVPHRNDLGHKSFILCFQHLPGRYSSIKESPPAVTLELTQGSSKKKGNSIPAQGLPAGLVTVVGPLAGTVAKRPMRKPKGCCTLPPTLVPDILASGEQESHYLAPYPPLLKVCLAAISSGEALEPQLCSIRDFSNLLPFHLSKAAKEQIASVFGEAAIQDFLSLSAAPSSLHTCILC